MKNTVSAQKRTAYTGEDVRKALLETVDQFDDGPYWRFQEEGKFLSHFLKLAHAYIVKHMPTTSKIKDICGGNGNLGLALAQSGFDDYTLMDNNEEYLKWGKLLHERFNMDLKTMNFDVRYDNTTPHDADVVTVLGWENFDFSYLKIFLTARNHLKNTGLLLFTFQDDEIVRSSEWETYFTECHAGWDRCRKPGYGHYVATFTEIETWLRQAGLAPLMRELAHGQNIVGTGGTVFPQYLVAARPLECAAQGKKSYHVRTRKGDDIAASSNADLRAGKAPLSEYRFLLQSLKKNPRVRFVPLKSYRDFLPKNREIVIGLRHDVDGDLPMARRCADVESSLCIPGTYFMLFTAPYYGNYDYDKETFYRNSDVQDILGEIQNSGSEIGVHNDQWHVLLNWNIDPATFLHNELEFLRNNGLSIQGTAGHCSLYTYDGVSNIEFFHGQTINNRQWASSGSTLVPVGRYKLSEFGLTYDAGFIFQVCINDRDISVGEIHTDPAGTVEFPHGDFTARFVLIKNEWYMYSYPERFDIIQTSEIVKYIENYPTSAKFIIDSHPEHFFDDL